MNRKYGEKGQALVIVLIILLLVSVIATSTAALITESLKTNSTYDYNTISTYSAEAGIQDSICKIENDSSTDLNNFFTGLPSSQEAAANTYVNPPYNPLAFAPYYNPIYSDYDYTDTWAYLLPNSPVPTTLNGTTTTTPVNNQNVNVYMENVWVPVGISVPAQATVQAMLADPGFNNLIISGTVGVAGTYNVTVTSKGTGPIPLTSIGVWLPQGFSCQPNTVQFPSGVTFTEQASVPDAGNQAVIWTLSNYLLGAGATLQFSFNYSTSTGNYPTALSWVTVGQNSYFNYSYTWDLSTKVHLITADAGNTTIQCYSPKSETILPAGESGDYYATGSASMMPTNDVAFRDLLLNSSSATTVPTSGVNAGVPAIPSDAQVNAAYLYWSGWVQNYGNGIFWDQCEVPPGSSANLGISPNTVSVPSNWNQTGTWSVYTNNPSNTQQYNQYFVGTGSCSLTTKNNIDLSNLTSYTSGSNQITSVTISWMQQGSGTMSLELATNGIFSSPVTIPIATTWQSINVQILSTGAIIINGTTLSNGVNYAPYLSSSFKMDLIHSGSGLTSVNLDDILVADDGMAALANPIHYDPAVTLSITNAANNTLTSNVSPTGVADLHQSYPVSSARNGTITFTNNSNGTATVTGNGTTFESDVIAGNYIRSNNDTNTWYYVTNVNSDTSLTVSTQYTGSNNSQATYYVQDGYYYACKADVTRLVQQGSTIVAPATSGNGNGTYTVTNLYGSTNSAQYFTPLQYNPSGLIANSSYAGWSLVIVYADASTLGHQLYLYDEFTSVPNKDGNNPFVINENLSGFIVPGKLPSEISNTNADVAKLTIFAGEGDVGLTGDFVAYVNSANQTTELWDGITVTGSNTGGATYNTLGANGGGTENNVWNGSFIDQATMQPSAVPGIDIDTFHIKWGDNLIHTNDTSANIELSTNGDGYVLVYMIMSFRSLVTNGGSISYLITRKPQTP